jgi:Spy/CpxP family protein refolding chaperone
MKLNKTLALIALVGASLLAGATLQAQDEPKDKPPGDHGGPGGPGGPGMRGRPSIDQMVDQMAKNLNLTDDQKTKVKAAMEDQQAKMKALREDTSLSQEDRRAKMKEIREGFVAKMKTILTADQFEKWQKHQRPHPPQGRGEKPGPGDGGSNPPGKD